MSEHVACLDTVETWRRSDSARIRTCDIRQWML